MSHRTRTVFGSHASLAHIWAQQTFDYGRSSDGRMLFHGPTLHSYSTRYTIARFTDVELDHERVVLFNSDTYSVSTRKHHSLARRALRGLAVKTFSVPFVGTSQDEALGNASYLAKQWADSCARLAKPHVSAWFPDGDTLDNRLAKVCDLARDLLDFDRAFELGAAAEIHAAVTQKQEEIRQAFAAYNDPKKAAKRAKDAGKRQLKYAAAMSHYHAWHEGLMPSPPSLDALPISVRREAQRQRAEWAGRAGRKRRITLEQWIAGQGTATALTADIYLTDFYSTYVRRVGDRLETSRGAVVPWQHAVIAFLKAQRCRVDGTAWQRNGGQVPVGHYQLDSIDAEGNIHAGCHTILWGEMLRLAITEIPELVRPTYPLPIAV